jgi:hypothetical protein
MKQKIQLLYTIDASKDQRIININFLKLRLAEKKSYLPHLCLPLILKSKYPLIQKYIHKIIRKVLF